MEKRKVIFFREKDILLPNKKWVSFFLWKRKKKINVDTTAKLLSPTSPLEDPSQDCAYGRHRARSPLWLQQKGGRLANPDYSPRSPHKSNPVSLRSWHGGGHAQTDLMECVFCEIESLQLEHVLKCTRWIRIVELLNWIVLISNLPSFIVDGINGLPREVSVKFLFS